MSHYEMMRLLMMRKLTKPSAGSAVFANRQAPLRCKQHAGRASKLRKKRKKQQLLSKYDYDATSLIYDDFVLIYDFKGRRTK